MTRRKLTALVADDEELSRRYLRELLAAQPEIEIAAECADGFEAVKAASEISPDLVFLDVQMPKLDGFEVLELIEPVPAVIFVTAHDRYALRAFEVHAVDYLLKPFGEDRFREALERALQRLGETLPPAADLADAARPPSRYLERIVVKDGPSVHVIPAAELDYAEAQDDYVALCAGGRKLLKQQTLTSLEARLDPAQFVRVHRRCLVNLERVARIEPYGKGTRLAILRDGTRLPVSESGYARLKTLLGDAG